MVLFGAQAALLFESVRLLLFFEEDSSNLVIAVDDVLELKLDGHLQLLDFVEVIPLNFTKNLEYRTKINNGLLLPKRLTNPKDDFQQPYKPD